MRPFGNVQRVLLNAGRWNWCSGDVREQEESRQGTNKVPLTTPNYPNHQPAADDLMTIPETARTSLVSPRPTDPPSVLKEGDVLLEVRVANPLMKPWYSLNICKAQSSKQTIDPHLLQPCMCMQKIIQYPEGIGMRHTLCMQVGKYKVDNFGAVRMPFAQLRLSIFRRPSTDTGSLSSPLPDSLMWDGPEYWVYLWQTYHALVSLRLGQRVALSAAPSSDDLKVPRAVNAHHFELFRSDAVSYLDTKGSKVKEFQDVNCQSVRWVMDCPRHRICSMSVMLRGNCGA